MSEINILSKFKCALISFIDELISQFPEEGDLVILRIIMKDRAPITDVINMFVIKVLPLKDMITNRNEDFILNHCELFNSFNSDQKVNHFKKLWRSGRLDEEDQDIVWKWFESLIFLVEKYQQIKSKNVNVN
jgi:hypothetical protein